MVTPCVKLKQNWFERGGGEANIGKTHFFFHNFLFIVFQSLFFVTVSRGLECLCQNQNKCLKNTFFLKCKPSEHGNALCENLKIIIWGKHGQNTFFFIICCFFFKFFFFWFFKFSLACYRIKWVKMLMLKKKMLQKYISFKFWDR